MPLTLTTLDKGPRPTRSRRKVVESTAEWQEFLKLLDKRDLKPYEAIYVTFDPTEIKRHGLKAAARAFRDLARQVVKVRALPYDVERFHAQGKETVRISGRPVTGKKAHRLRAVA